VQEKDLRNTSNEKLDEIIKELTVLFGSPNLDISVKLDVETKDQDSIRIERFDKKVICFIPQNFLQFSERRLRSYLYTLYRTEVERAGLYKGNVESELNTYLRQKELWGASQILRWIRLAQKILIKRS
jgi:hypothetical protein